MSYAQSYAFGIHIAQLQARIEQLEAAGDAAFFSMCAYRDSPDEEVFQNAIDALGTALARKEGDMRPAAEIGLLITKLRIENKKLSARIERLEAALKENNHHLAKLVNGTDEDDPATWEAAKNQVLATRAALSRKEGT